MAPRNYPPTPEHDPRPRGILYKACNKDQPQAFVGERVKYVKKAGMFCRTFFNERGVQCQEWFTK